MAKGDGRQIQRVDCLAVRQVRAAEQALTDTGLALYTANPYPVKYPRNLIIFLCNLGAKRERAGQKVEWGLRKLGRVQNDDSPFTSVSTTDAIGLVLIPTNSVGHEPSLILASEISHEIVRPEKHIQPDRDQRRHRPNADGQR